MPPSIYINMEDLKLYKKILTKKKKRRARLLFSTIQPTRLRYYQVKKKSEREEKPHTLFRRLAP